MTAAQKQYEFESQVTGATYRLNTQPATWFDAQQACNDQGGHLAAWASQEEQTDVENAFLKMGVLLPSYHRNYWMGLNTTMWPLFYWVDPLVPQTDSPKAYVNWALGEPNNMNAPEFCGSGDLTRTRMGAAGWADMNCQNGLVYICKIPLLDLASLVAAAPTYTTNSTGITFAFVPYKTASTNAQQACNMVGGNLAAFTHVSEQAEVERYYISKVGAGYSQPPGPPAAACAAHAGLRAAWECR